MAQRPVFIPGDGCGVQARAVQFKWHPGMSKAQKLRNVMALHEAARELGLSPLLEVSTKSPDPLGVRLSAMNLALELSDGRRVPVECAFQSSKVFERAGPLTDLLDTDPRRVKRDPRLQVSGDLRGFRFQGTAWDLEPQTAFYDWLYIKALVSKPSDARQLPAYRGFTDIEFNPRKSINTQAHACARYVAFVNAGVLEQAMRSQDAFLVLVGAADDTRPEHELLRLKGV